MWKLTIEDDQTHRTVVPLVRDEYSVGRAAGNTIRLTERNVSREHARLRKSGEKWLLRDLESYNGCFVNGVRVSSELTLTHGDLIQLGDYRLELFSEAQLAKGQEKSSGSGKAVTLVGQPDRMVLLRGPTIGLEYPLRREGIILLGRGEDCDISINHPSVSRHHAEIHPLSDGHYEIVDKVSSNGVRVNGVEMPRSLLDAHDLVELGDVVLKFIPEGEIYVVTGDEAIDFDAEATQEAVPLPPSPRSASLPKIALGLSLLAACVLAVVVVSNTNTPKAEVRNVQAPVDPALEILRQAHDLFSKGDVFLAAQKASELPELSAARQSSTYQAIQAGWADALLTQASRSSNNDEQRSLLEQVANSKNVDAARRKQALERLEKLKVQVVNIDALPSAVPTVDVNNLSQSAAGSSGRGQPGVEALGGAGVLTPASAAKPNAASAARPALPAAAPRPTPRPAPTLIRDNPY